MMVVSVVEIVDDLWFFKRKVRNLFGRQRVVASNHEWIEVSRILDMTKQLHPSANIHMPFESYVIEHGETKSEN